MKSFLITLLTGLLIVGCSVSNDDSQSGNPIKIHPSDPFKESMVKSQFIHIDAKKDNVVEGENGTLISIPQGAFLGYDEKIADGNIQIELAEALSASDMLLSNLTTTSEGKLLQTDGMIYINAKQNGKSLKINPENPVYIEIPTAKRKPGMMVYRGERDETGNMNWFNPKPIQNYLVSVDISTLDFYPQGFEAEVTNGLPFRKHKKISEALTDSLYYSLSLRDTAIRERAVARPIDMNEPYYNPNAEVQNGRYTDKSYERYDNSSEGESSRKIKGVDPAIIKVIKSKKYKNTLIATREFEKRLQSIFKTCNSNVLLVYVKNLDKDMWVLDSMAADLLKGTNNEMVFRKYAEEKLTNVKFNKKSIKKLNEYYDVKIKKVKDKLEKLRKDAADAERKHNGEIEKIKGQYREVLWEREKYRMEKYGFEWTNTGWINVDMLIVVTDEAKLEMKLNNQGYDRAYCYVVYSSYKSIFRMNTDVNKLFYISNRSDDGTILPLNSQVYAVAVAYKGDEVFMEIKEFITVRDKVLELSPTSVSKSELKKRLDELNKDYTQENRIDEDLQYMEVFYKENHRRLKLQQEYEFIHRLEEKAFPCCGNIGQMSYEEIDKVFMGTNCGACHNIATRKVGPALGGISKRRSMDWIKRFIRNSDKVKASGDPYTTQLTREYGGMAMPQHDLSDCEIEKLVEYIEWAYENKTRE